MELSEHEKNIEWRKELPPMYFDSVETFEALPEYSAAMPTGTTLGKTWRVNMSFQSGFSRKLPAPDFWIVRRYEDAGSEMRGVAYRPVIRVKCRQEIVTV